MNILATRWTALAPRERVMVGSAIALIAAAVLWWVGISPALAKLRQAREAAPQLDAQLQLMRAQASEAASLKAQRALSYDESLRSLENSVKTLGAGASLSVSDARASITLRGVSGDALAAWLAQVRANARLVPSELRLKKAAGATPAVTLWDGSIVLSLPTR
ncbi:type II secretion system protein M [Variovorax sp. PCZ-1]|nr:type II secretion system protein M [Variovorax sp. PCZ-1]